MLGIRSQGVPDSDVRYDPEELAVAANGAKALADPSDSRLAAVRFQPEVQDECPKYRH